MPVRYNANSDILGVIDHPPGALTVTTWVKPASNLSSTGQLIFGFISLDGPYLGLYAEVSGQHLFISTDSGESGSSATIPLATWSHVALVWDGTTITAYINGTNSWTRTASPALTGTVYMLLGSSGATGWFDGSMSDVKVWSATLSPTEIATEYLGSAPQRTSNLWSYWTLVSATDLADSSGNARALGLFGTSPTTDTAGPGAFGQETYVASDSSSIIKVSPPTVPMGISDDFNAGTINGTTWLGYGATTSGPVLSITPTGAAGNYAGVVSNATYDLTGHYVRLRVVQRLSGAVGTLCGIQLQPGSNGLEFLVLDGVLVARTVSGATTVVASGSWPAGTQYLRIHEAGGTIYWMYSSDGTAWTLFGSAPTPFAITAVKVSILAGCYSTVSSPGTAQFDDLNPATSGDASLNLVDAATLSESGTRVATDGLTDAAQLLDASVISISAPGSVVLTGSISVQAASTGALGLSGGREVIPNNGLSSTLVAGISATDTALTIASADAAAWAGPGGVYRAIVWQDPLNGPWEIVRVTSSQGVGGLTVERATEPTAGVQTARAWPSGASIAAIATYAGLNAILDAADLHIQQDEFVPSAAATTVSLAYVPEQIHMVARNGVIQSQTAGHYSVSGTTLTFASSFSGSERVVVGYSTRGQAASFQLFDNSFVPDSSAADNQFGGMTMGFHFHVTAPGLSARAVRFYYSSAATFTSMCFSMYADSGPTLLWTGSMGPFVPGWNTFPITPVPLTSGALYQVNCQPQDNYWHWDHNSYLAGRSSGPLVANYGTYDFTGCPGTTSQAQDARWYGADVVVG